MWTRRIVLLFLAAALVAFCVSCETDEDENGDNGDSGEIRIAFQFVGTGGSAQGLDNVRIEAFLEDEEGEDEQIDILFEDFEGEGSGDDDDDDDAKGEGGGVPDFPPAGWELDSLNEPPYSWFIGAANLYIDEVYEGDWIAEVFGSMYYQNEWLITPPLKIEGYDEVELTFYTAGSVDLSDRQTLVVNITIDGGGRWAEIDRFSRENDRDNYQWNEHEVDITDPASFFEEIDQTS